MNYIAKISDGGAIDLPLALRERLGVQTGDEVILQEGEDGSVQLMTYQQRLDRARALVNACIPADVCLSDAVREMRREEFERENRD